MNKRIMSLVLALSVVLGMSAVMHAEEKTAETKEETAVTTVEEKEKTAEEKEEVLSDGEETAETEEEAEESLVITLTIGQKSIFTNGEETELDVAPVIINDRTMVPLRAIFEALGAAVTWDDETKTVMAVKDNTSVALQIGGETMFVNDKKLDLDSPAVIVDDRTMVPARAIAEAFGNNVAYDDETKTVTITNAENTVEEAEETAETEEAEEEKAEETAQAEETEKVDAEAEAQAEELPKEDSKE